MKGVQKESEFSFGKKQAFYKILRRGDQWAYFFQNNEEKPLVADITLETDNLEIVSGEKKFRLKLKKGETVSRVVKTKTIVMHLNAKLRVKKSWNFTFGDDIEAALAYLG